MRLLSIDEKQKYYGQFFQMLSESDDDFVPPLSSRTTTRQENLSSCEKNADGIKSYLDFMMTQEILVKEEDGQILGFVSFVENYLSDVITEETFPNIYVSTLIVRKSARGMGLTKKMYDLLFNEMYKEKNIYTRTWSTNMAHIKILSFFGFNELLRKVNDRGEGIDTVYFVKKAL